MWQRVAEFLPKKRLCRLLFERQVWLGIAVDKNVCAGFKVVMAAMLEKVPMLGRYVRNVAILLGIGR